MPRLPDKPGTYRVSQRNGQWLLSGLRDDGQRIKLRFATDGEAHEMAGKLWAKPDIDVPTTTVELDDWGFPKTLSADNLNAVNAAVGVSVQPQSAPQGAKPELTAAEKAERKKRARSLSEFIGVGYAAGIVFTSRRITENAGKVPVNPSPKQVNDLADSTRDTLQEWFGDREIKPWHMMILLTFAIPASMMLQSRKVDQPTDATRPDLKAVP